MGAKSIARDPDSVGRRPQGLCETQKRVAFTRFNLFLRDEFCCQYCGAKGDLTFDHVVPRSRGGTTTWENVVAACSSCNLRKGNKSLRASGLSLRRPPRQPGSEELRNTGRRFPPNHLHDSWVDYLYWDAELEARVGARGRANGSRKGQGTGRACRVPA